MEFIPMVIERNGVPMTTSRAVAEQFGKRHAHILRDIENLISELAGLNFEPSTEPNFGLSGKDFAASNFVPVSYTDSTGRSLPMYLLTRDGFTLLTMGFTGAKALRFKVAYIETFNRMEQLIRNGSSSAALPSSGSRLHALENAPDSPVQTLDEISYSFLQALQNAIDSGEYVLVAGYRGGNPVKGKVLGRMRYDYIDIPAMLAYQIYSGSTGSPKSRLVLWSRLEEAGVIFKRDSERFPYVKIGEKSFVSIHIRKGLLHN